MKYSERLGEISNKQIQQALTKHGLGKLIETKVIEEGLFGQNFFVTSTHGEFVFRGKPHFDWQFETEKYFADKLFTSGIPTPNPYIVDNDTSIFGWSFVIMPKLNGTSISGKLDEKFLTDEDRLEIARAQGTFLAKIQELKFPFCGRYSVKEKEVVEFPEPYSDHLHGMVLDRLKKAQTYDGADSSNQNIDWFETKFAKLSPALTDFTPTVVLQDYKFENTLACKTNASWEICALFDLMECYIGHPESDLARTYCKYVANDRKDLADIFIETWKERVNPDEHFTERFPLFIILDRSIIWEWRQRDKSAQGEEFSLFVEQYIDL